jgi:hypothetical protein
MVGSAVRRDVMELDPDSANIGRGCAAHARDQYTEFIQVYFVRIVHRSKVRGSIWSHGYNRYDVSRQQVVFWRRV